MRNRVPVFDGERTKEIPAGILHNRSLGNHSLNMSEMTIGCVCAEKMKLLKVIVIEVETFIL
jgi:hypothetical protein